MNKKLIEEARDPNLPYERRYDIRQELADALEAAVKAHTPTGDEREALLRAMRAGWAKRQEWWTTTEAPADAPTNDEFLADAILVAGFRRTEAPEPSAEEWRAGEQSVADAMHYIANPEPLGEPSDARVRAVWDALGPRNTVHISYDDLAAALRAAWEV